MMVFKNNRFFKVCFFKNDRFENDIFEKCVLKNDRFYNIRHFINEEWKPTV